MPKVSVVMPAYNVEKYIGQAFDSLISQTFTDWECCVVNDASTDGTLKIIEEYAVREPRIRYKTLDKNTGAAKIPRDTAIAMSSSEWIVMLDADDTLAANVIENLILRQIETEADIVLPSMLFTDEDGNVTKRYVPAIDFDFSQIITGLEAAALTIGSWTIGMNGSLIPKKIYDNRHILSSVDREYLYNADEYDSRQMLIAANKVAFVDVAYYYRQNPASITKTFDIKRFGVLLTNKALQKLIEANYGSDHSIIEKMKRQRFAGIIDCRYLLLKNRNKLSKQNYLFAGKLIEENYNDICRKNRVIRSHSLIKRFLLTHNYTLFKTSTYLFVKIKKQNER